MSVHQRNGSGKSSSPLKTNTLGICQGEGQALHNLRNTQPFRTPGLRFALTGCTNADEQNQRWARAEAMMDDRQAAAGSCAVCVKICVLPRPMGVLCVSRANSLVAVTHGRFVSWS